MTKFAPALEKIGTFAFRLRFSDRSRSLSFDEVIALWSNDGDFRSAFVQSLAATPFEAFFWECPPLTKPARNNPFECVLVSGPALQRAADPSAFARHFANPLRERVTAFKNLGGDAELIVPLPATGADHAHLAVFLRTAPVAQVDELWQTVGEVVAKRSNDGPPLWLSTAGLGVPWLHMRLDSLPKYYTHAPYKVVL